MVSEEFINITQGITPEKAVEIAHQTTAEPALWIAWIGFNGILIAVTALLKGKSNWGKFWQIFGVTAFLSLLFIIFLANSPNFVQEISNIVGSLFK